MILRAAILFHEPRSAGVSPAGSPSVSLGVGAGGETPPEPAAEDGRATVALVHGPKVHPILEVGASHEPERRSPTRLVGSDFLPTGRDGGWRSHRLVHGAVSRSERNKGLPMNRGAGFPACGFTGLSSPVFPSRVIIRFMVPRHIQFWKSPLLINFQP
jgi:hypothetical protein